MILFSLQIQTINQLYKIIIYSNFPQIILYTSRSIQYILIKFELNNTYTNLILNRI